MKITFNLIFLHDVLGGNSPCCFLAKSNPFRLIKYDKLVMISVMPKVNNNALNIFCPQVKIIPH